MVTALSASHDRVDLDLRARLGVPADDVPALLRRLSRRLGPCVLLQTCNRFELYLAANPPRELVEAAFAAEAGVELAAAGTGLQLLRDGDAARHLFRVAAGLESMVLGEHEILGQVRRAYTAAVDAEVSSPVLARMFHGAVRAGRRARADTSISAGVRSVARLAAERAIAAFAGDLADARVLVIGAGDAARQGAVALRDAGAARFTVANRTRAHAEVLAADLAGAVLPLDAIAAATADADIVLAAAAVSQPLLRPADLDQRPTGGRALLLLDLGVPRNIAAEVAALPDVRYCDIDELRSAASASLQARDLERPRAEAIVEAELARFAGWLDERDAAPSIARLVERAERVRRAQVERTARALGADDNQRARLEAMSRAIVKQLLHPAIVSARRTEPGGEGVRALRALFQLDSYGGARELREAGDA